MSFGKIKIFLPNGHGFSIPASRQPSPGEGATAITLT
jgi:hypothetical protein